MPSVSGSAIVTVFHPGPLVVDEFQPNGNAYDDDSQISVRHVEIYYQPFPATAECANHFAIVQLMKGFCRTEDGYVNELSYYDAARNRFILIDEPGPMTIQSGNGACAEVFYRDGVFCREDLPFSADTTDIGFFDQCAFSIGRWSFVTEVHVPPIQDGLSFTHGNHITTEE